MVKAPAGFNTNQEQYNNSRRYNADDGTDDEINGQTQDGGAPSMAMASHQQSRLMTEEAASRQM